MPRVFKTMGAKGFLAKLWKEISEDGVFTWASALAYAWVFALFPLLIAILTLAPYLPGQTKEKAKQQVTASIQQAGVGGQAAKTVQDSINEVMDNTKGGLLSFGLILALWGASGGMAMTMTALDKAYEVTTERSFIMQRLVALGLTLATIVLVLLVLVLIPVGGAITAYFASRGVLAKPVEIGIDVARYAIAVGLLFAIVSLVYYFGPHIKQKWQAISPGAVAAVAIWILAAVGFSVYVNNFASFNKTYGALGAAIALLLFFYISATVLLVGAEINSVFDFAVLGVQPGTRDFTCEPKSQDALSPVGAGKADGSPAESSAADTQQAGVARPGAAGDGPKRPAVAAPVGPAPGDWWKWAAAAVAGSWLARKAAGGTDKAGPPTWDARQQQRTARATAPEAAASRATAPREPAHVG